jgi:hypothetical protein
VVFCASFSKKERRAREGAVIQVCNFQNCVCTCAPTSASPDSPIGIFVLLPILLCLGCLISLEVGGKLPIGKSGSIVLVVVIACLAGIVFVLASGAQLDAGYFLKVIKSLAYGVLWIFAAVAVSGVSMHR